MSRISDLSRPVMAEVGRGVLKNLQERAAAGPQEPGLEAFIPELEGVVVRLETHVGGSVLADAARKAQLVRVENADCDVDTWLRHVENFVWIEATRRVGPNVALALALHHAAFEDGLSIVDDYIPDENRVCRESIAALRSAEHAPTLAAIGLPQDWIPTWEAALNESDAAFAARDAARADKSKHVGGGQDTENDFVDVMLRLRKYIGSRASRKDKAKIAEGEALLKPLLDALKKARADQAARATRNAKDAPGETPPAATPDAPKGEPG
jgi:hypothetical protein